MKISKEKTIEMMNDHGMNTKDCYDFFKEFGVKDSYKLSDVRNFLGY